MSIPSRFRLVGPSDEVVQAMCRLCTLIEREIELGGDAADLLALWHQQATRVCDPGEFTSYWKSTDQEEFVREALAPRPVFVEDLTHAEAVAVLDEIRAVRLPEHETSYFLQWLDVQFPGARIRDLMYWPDEWFADRSLVRNADGTFKPESDLTAVQILEYAMHRSGRRFPDAPPGVEVPFPLDG